MAYDARGLSVLSYSNGFTMWHYHTYDEASEVAKDPVAYFRDGSDMLRNGDLIIVNAANGDFQVFYRVASSPLNNH